MEQGIPLKLGILSKFISLLLTINYIGQLIKNYYYYIFSNIPLFTVLQLELWRIFTGFLTSCSLYEYLFNLFITFTIFNHWENKEGTIKHSGILFGNLLIFQTSMLILYLILFWFFPIILSFSIKSLPALGIAFLVKHLLLTDSKTIIVYPNIVINDRLLIASFLIGFIILCGFEFRIELIVSLYYGFLMCKYYKFYEIQMINEHIINSFENNDKYKALFSLDGWILYDERYSLESKEASSNVNINININNDNDNDNDNTKELHQDNTIGIIEDKQDNNIQEIDQIVSESKIDIDNDFVDLSLEDNNN